LHRHQHTENNNQKEKEVKCTGIIDDLMPKWLLSEMEKHSL